MPLFGLLAAASTGPRYSSGSVLTGSRATIPDEVAVNASPDAIQVLLMVLAVVAAIAIITFVVCLIVNPPQNRHNRNLRRRMEQDRAFLQSSYFNTAFGIMNEVMKHRR